MSGLIFFLERQINMSLSCKEVTKKSQAIKNLYEMLQMELVLSHTTTHRAVKCNFSSSWPYIALGTCFINSWFALTFDISEGSETQGHGVL